MLGKLRPRRPSAAKAADADWLDGRDASSFGQILDSGIKATTLTQLEAGACTLDGPITQCVECTARPGYGHDEIGRPRSMTP